MRCGAQHDQHHPPDHSKEVNMRRPFHSPLARYGFTACALLAWTTGQPWPALTTTALAAYAWRTPHRHRRRTRSPK